jgi:hypothetical protein
MSKLSERGLGDNLVKEKTALLGFPEEYYAEIVLDDAGKISAANEALTEVAAQLKRENEKLDYIVRALWKVQEVRLAPDYKAEAIPDLMKQGIFSLRFLATLESGERCKKEVGVELTPSAYEELRRLGQPTDENSLKDVVRDFLKLQLSFGGESYWDPIRYPRQQLNDMAVLHLHYHPVPAA